MLQLKDTLCKLDKLGEIYIFWVNLDHAQKVDYWFPCSHISHQVKGVHTSLKPVWIQVMTNLTFKSRF